MISACVLSPIVSAILFLEIPLGVSIGELMVKSWFKTNYYLWLPLLVIIIVYLLVIFALSRCVHSFFQEQIRHHSYVGAILNYCFEKLNLNTDDDHAEYVRVRNELDDIEVIKHICKNHDMLTEDEVASAFAAKNRLFDNIDRLAQEKIINNIGFLAKMLRHGKFKRLGSFEYLKNHELSIIEKLSRWFRSSIYSSCK